MDDDDEEDDMASYTAKIRKKLGATKSRVLLGIGGDDDEMDDDNDDAPPPARDLGHLGALSLEEEQENEAIGGSAYAPPKNDGGTSSLRESSCGDDDEDDDSGQLSDEALVDLVAQRLQQKPLIEEPEVMTTTGIGGSRQSSTKDAAKEDVYQPKTGSWGAFPRPRDISKACGGGRRVGPGYSNEKARAESIELTRAKLQEYRRSSGIEVESEKENAEAIEEA